MPDDDFQPPELGGRVDGVDPPDEDLQRSLVGVERVVVAQRGLTSHAQESALVARRDCCYADPRVAGDTVDLCDCHLSPSVRLVYSRNMEPRSLPELAESHHFYARTCGDLSANCDSFHNR